MKYIKYVLAAAFALLIIACSLPTKSIKTDIHYPQVVDNKLFNISQDATTYAKLEQTQEVFKDLKDKYLGIYYSVWTTKPTATKAETFWIIPSLQNAIKADDDANALIAEDSSHLSLSEKLKRDEDIKKLIAKRDSLLGFGENLMPNTISDFKKLIANMNVDSFYKNPQNAIIVNNTNVRAVPTLKPRYKNRHNFPFDRWQNSSMFEGTPVVITQFSTDGKFAHVHSAYVDGWVLSNDVALVDPKLQDFLLKLKNYKVTNEDNTPLNDPKRLFFIDAKIGQLFPYDKTSDKLILFKKGLDGYAKKVEIAYPKTSFKDFPIPFSDDMMANLINTMMGEKYGWGGIFGNRDCSAFTRDSFANFGIFLPRNSASQANYTGNLQDLSKMTNEQKESYIIANGVPFRSIIWLKGHIMIYIGTTTIDGKQRALVAHDAWSVTGSSDTNKEVIMLGGVHITTMTVGASFDGESSKKTLLSRAIGISNIME
ncbi:SH3 domain-containing protein [Helicobacter sp. 11S02629-2]|uniref:SH3 domain-containing protein n=1 Tax=Helicobacter sp. 11S02629-2 TaxID=1476195 RepID=UPI000BA67BD2|nr:SH3 domain-containing protein [Helicobacter sp. 11S02629-2]PAF45866.1 hypothetical protein BKH40_00160 [Helicobacter sp. 11S02629-2]